MKNHESPQNTTVERARSRMSAATDRANQVVDSATSQVGAGIDSAARRVASGAQRAADRVSRAGHYLDESSPKQLGSDLTNFVRSHPKTSIAVGVGLGFLVVRLLSRRK